MSWLSSPPLAMFNLVVTAIGVPLLVVGNWGLAKSAVCWVRRVRFERKWKRDEAGSGAVSVTIGGPGFLEEFRREYGIVCGQDALQSGK